MKKMSGGGVITTTETVAKLDQVAASIAGFRYVWRSQANGHVPFDRILAFKTLLELERSMKQYDCNLSLDDLEAELEANSAWCKTYQE
ncbi:hypothetical protein ACFQBQ_05800 [Granulicella cerasi]|uniref:Uncharacterized protein n=1 Tax=Granulicella cerasi TaxID=741063 RepID=A0ABW1Z7H7_9BACT|nr:hypothetical protein [Granulicella cerasi]